MALRSFFRTNTKLRSVLSTKNQSSWRCFSTRSELFHEQSLTEDQQQFQDLMHNFFKKELTPELVSRIDKEDKFDEFRSFWKKMGLLGLLGITAPKEFGGLEMGYFEHCLAMETMSQYSGGLALSYGAHSNLNVNQLTLNGSDFQKEKYLPKLIDGSFVGALAMSEPNSGSDVTSMRTSAEKKGDYYVLNGSKFWITNGPEADVIIVYAKTSAKGITTFIVEKDFPGFSVGKKIEKMGMRGSPTSELIFENCKVPESNIVGEVNKGVYVLMSGLDYERLVLAGGPMGIMQRACDVGFEYAHERRQFGVEIGKFQQMQAKMADMFTETLFCRAALYQTARNLDKYVANTKNDPHFAKNEAGTSEFTAKCAAIILKCAESATKVANETVQILGGNGYTEDYEASRLFRDAKLYEIGAGTSEIRRWLIGREINKVYSR